MNILTNHKSICLIMLLLLLTSGCASITETKTQSVSVNTGDITGATCTLSNSKGTWYINSTPGSVTVRQACDDLTIACTKDGYYAQAPASIADESKGMAWGNIIFGGIPGIIVDRQTGAGCKYQSNLYYPMKKN